MNVGWDAAQQHGGAHLENKNWCGKKLGVTHLGGYNFWLYFLSPLLIKVVDTSPVLRMLQIAILFY